VQMVSREYPERHSRCRSSRPPGRNSIRHEAETSNVDSNEFSSERPPEIYVTREAQSLPSRQCRRGGICRGEAQRKSPKI